jgi:hypothetical protein
MLCKKHYRARWAGATITGIAHASVAGKRPTGIAATPSAPGLVRPRLPQAAGDDFGGDEQK